MNLLKFINDDVRLFRLLLGVLFPSLELPVTEMGALHPVIDDELVATGWVYQSILSCLGNRCSSSTHE